MIWTERFGLIESGKSTIHKFHKNDLDRKIWINRIWKNYKSKNLQSTSLPNKNVEFWGCGKYTRKGRGAHRYNKRKL